MFELLSYILLFEVQQGLQEEKKRFTAQTMKFSIKGFFSKWGQIRSFARISSHLLKKSLMENFTFCAVIFHFCSKKERHTFPILIVSARMFLHPTEAATESCSLKQVFIKTMQNPRNNCK